MSTQDIITSHVNEWQLKYSLPGQTLEGWRASPELPLARELMAEVPPAIPNNPVDRPWPSKDEYLATQYRLQRFEGTELLRQTVRKYREHPEMMEEQDSYIYTQVLRGSCHHRLCTFAELFIGPRPGLPFVEARCQLSHLLLYGALLPQS